MSLNVESMSNHAKTVLLARLASTLTICARDIYEVGTDRVVQPELLRGYNELLHRVTRGGQGPFAGKQRLFVERHSWDAAGGSAKRTDGSGKCNGLWSKPLKPSDRQLVRIFPVPALRTRRISFSLQMLHKPF